MLETLSGVRAISRRQGLLGQPGPPPRRLHGQPQSVVIGSSRGHRSVEVFMPSAYFAN